MEKMVVNRYVKCIFVVKLNNDNFNKRISIVKGKCPILGD